MKIQPLTIRLARRIEADQLAMMSRDLIEQGLGWSWTAPRIVRNIQSPDTIVITARLGHELAGFAVMYFAADHAHLNLLAVRPQYQRKGIGRRLIEWLEKSARVAGITDVYLEVRTQNMAARNFYRALGYIEFEEIRGYYNRVETAVRMVHDLRVRDTRKDT